MKRKLRFVALVLGIVACGKPPSTSAVPAVMDRPEVPDDPVYELSQKSAEALSHVDERSGKYWFYIRENPLLSHGKQVVHYSQILECPKRVTTPGVFSKIHGVGPFGTYEEASAVRRDELDLAIKTGKKTILETAVCDLKWQ